MSSCCIQSKAVDEASGSEFGASNLLMSDELVEIAKLRARDQVAFEWTDKTTSSHQQCEDDALISPFWVVLLLAHLLPRGTTNKRISRIANTRRSLTWKTVMMMHGAGYWPFQLIYWSGHPEHHSFLIVGVSQYVGPRKGRKLTSQTNFRDWVYFWMCRTREFRSKFQYVGHFLSGVHVNVDTISCPCPSHSAVQCFLFSRIIG